GGLQSEGLAPVHPPRGRGSRQRAEGRPDSARVALTPRLRWADGRSRFRGVVSEGVVSAGVVIATMGKGVKGQTNPLRFFPLNFQVSVDSSTVHANAH